MSPLLLLPTLFPLPPLAIPSAQEAPHAWRIELEVRPIADLYCHLRVMASTRTAFAPDHPDFGAISAIRTLDQQLGHRLLAWGVVEGSLSGCHTGADLVAAFESLPERFELDGLDSAPLREPALRIAREVAALEPTWLRAEWPQRLPALMEAATRLRVAFESHPEALAELAAAMNLRPAGAVVPMVLVTDAPWPGAYTFRRPGGGGLCFVGLKRHPGSQLLETALHESLHALEAIQGVTPSLLSDLSSALAHAGLTTRDPAMRNVPHTLYFLHAADIVRRHFDPEHQDYGDVAAYYPKVAPVAEYERPLWYAYRAGELDQDELIELIVEQALAGR